LNYVLNFFNSFFARCLSRPSSKYHPPSTGPVVNMKHKQSSSSRQKSVEFEKRWGHNRAIPRPSH